MAHDLQNITCGAAGTNTRVIPVALSGHNDAKIAPFMLVSFLGNLTLDGSGVGDTASTRMTLPLPGNNAYQLHSFSMYTGITTDYADGVYTQYYSPNPADIGNTLQQKWGVYRMSGFDPDQSGTTDSPWAMTCEVPLPSSSRASVLLDSTIQEPSRVFTFGGDMGGSNPVIEVSGGTTTNVTSGTLRFVINYLAYTLDQSLSSSMYLGLSAR